MRQTMPQNAPYWRIFARIGFLSFGGPAAQIALMHKELVEDRPWLTEDQFLRALSFCMLLPGPEAMQLATYAGWRLGGTRLGLVAGLLFILPGAMLIMALAALYAIWGQVPLVQALFYGIKAAVLVIVIQALIKVSKRALHSKVDWRIAATAFIAIYALALPFPLIILTSGLYGFVTSTKAKMQPKAKPAIATAHTVQTIGFWLVLWAAPFVMVYLLAPSHIYLDIALFFSKLAIVTFGGAYAVLAYMAQDVVQSFGWLTAEQMIDALGLAETTPGPLILVTQFVGFLATMGAEQNLWMGFGGAVLTLWVTFVPCFMWIFTGAPYLEWLTDQPRLKGALSAITAAIVGVILNLSLWFGLHVMFGTIAAQSIGPFTLLWPAMGSLEWPALLIFAACAFAMFRLHWGLARLLPFAALLGTATLLI